MLCVWWSVHGIDHLEFLDDNTTVTASLYCVQLQRVTDALSRLRPQQDKVYFLHDNARPHVAKVTRQKIIDLGWELVLWRQQAAKSSHIIMSHVASLMQEPIDYQYNNRY